LEINSIFWKKFAVIVNHIKEKTADVLNFKISNWFYGLFASWVKITKRENWDYYLSWKVRVPDGTNNYQMLLEKDYSQEDIEEVIYLLTENIQSYFLEMRLGKIISILNENNLDVAYIRKRNWAKVEYELFNKEIPSRSVFMYLKDWDCYFSIDDATQPEFFESWLFTFKEADDYEKISKWLLWTPFAIKIS